MSFGLTLPQNEPRQKMWCRQHLRCLKNLRHPLKTLQTHWIIIEFLCTTHLSCEPTSRVSVNCVMYYVTLLTKLFITQITKEFPINPVIKTRQNIVGRIMVVKIEEGASSWAANPVLRFTPGAIVERGMATSFSFIKKQKSLQEIAIIKRVNFRW